MTALTSPLIGLPAPAPSGPLAALAAPGAADATADSDATGTDFASTLDSSIAARSARVSGEPAVARPVPGPDDRAGQRPPALRDRAARAKAGASGSRTTDGTTAHGTTDRPTDGTSDAAAGSGPTVNGAATASPPAEQTLAGTSTTPDPTQVPTAVAIAVAQLPVPTPDPRLLGAAWRRGTGDGATDGGIGPAQRSGGLASAGAKGIPGSSAAGTGARAGFAVPAGLPGTPDPVATPAAPGVPAAPGTPGAAAVDTKPGITTTPGLTDSSGVAAPAPAVPDGTAVASGLPNAAAPGTGNDSPATSTSIAEALAADATPPAAAPPTMGATAAGATANAPSGSVPAGASPPGVPTADPSGGPSTGTGGSPSNGSPGSPAAGTSDLSSPASGVSASTDPAAHPAPVTPAGISAATASKVAETATDAATSSLLNAAGAGAPQVQPDVSSGLGNTAASRTAAALPSHVAELARLARISADGTARLTVRLDPPELGAVTLHLVSRDSGVELSLRAETPAGAAALAGQQARVRDLLADHGFDLSKFTVTGVKAAEASSFGDQRSRDSAGTFAGDPRPGDNRFAADTTPDGRGNARSGAYGGFGADGSRDGDRSGARFDGRDDRTSPTRRSATPAATSTEGTWL